jgi:hypothetical protein
MLGRSLITFIICFQFTQAQGVTWLNANNPEPSGQQDDNSPEAKKKKKKEDEEKILDYSAWQVSGGTLISAGLVLGVTTYFAREKGKDAEKKLEINNDIKSIEKLRTRIKSFIENSPDAPINKLRELDIQLLEIEKNLLDAKNKSLNANTEKNRHKALQTELKVILDDLYLDFKKYNEIKSTENQPTYTNEVKKPDLKNNRYHFPGITEDLHDDLVPEKTTKNELSRKDAIEKIPTVCEIAYKKLGDISKNKKQQIPNPYIKLVPSALQVGVGAGMFGYAAWGTYRNNIKNLGEAKKIIEKKHDLETTQKVTLENLIKEDSKKVDTILEPFVTYTAEILTTNKDSIKQSIQTNFRFTPNTHIKEKIETESKNFENPAILKDAILKALAVSGDSAKAFTIDELEKKIYNHNPIEATTEYPKFLRKFYSEAIRQLYPLTMSDEKKEYISSDIFSELVDKTKKKMEIHKAQKKQSQDNKVSKADDDKKISGMFAQKPTPP